LSKFADRHLTVLVAGTRCNKLLSAFSPRADIEESGSEYILSFDLPGVKKEDVKIDIYGQMFSLTGVRKRESKEEKNRFRRHECEIGKFSRTWTLPEGIDAARVEATLADGILRVVVPKLQAQRPRAVEIK
jgi:HSP20 family protein